MMECGELLSECTSLVRTARLFVPWCVIHPVSPPPISGEEYVVINVYIVHLYRE